MNLSIPLGEGGRGIELLVMDSHYNKNLKRHSRDLRNHSTSGEIILWNKVLKNKQQLGFQFLRQFAIENYIVDFICRKARLIIEIDGYSHNFKYEKDIIRDNQLNRMGYKVLRFREKEIHQNIDNIIRTIQQYLTNLNY